MLMRRLFVVALLATVSLTADAEPLRMADIDAIRAHVSRHWRMPEGAAGAEYTIELQIELERDGTVTGVTILSPPTAGGKLWAETALSAKRAVYAASPLPIPADSFDHFKKFVLAFKTSKT